VRMCPDTSARIEADDANTLNRAPRVQIQEFVGIGGSVATAHVFGYLGDDLVNIINHRFKYKNITQAVIKKRVA